MGPNKRVIDIWGAVFIDINGLTRLRAPIAFDIFLTTWSFQVKCSSIGKPRDLTLWTLAIDFPLISMLISWFPESRIPFGWEPMTMNSVFANRNLFATTQAIETLKV